MSDAPVRVLAVIPLDVHRGAAGLPPSHAIDLAGRSALNRTLDRLKRCEQIDRIVLLTNGDADIDADGVDVHRVDAVFDDRHAWRIAARKWSPTAWRGGLGGMTCYDELLSASVMGEALDRRDATAALLVGPDWPLVDPTWCDVLIARYREAPEHNQCLFTAAPPGFVGMLLNRELLAHLAEAGDSIGARLDYQPGHPQIDPAERQSCLQIEPRLRDAPIRAVCDAPRWVRLIEAVIDDDPHMPAADAAAIMHQRRLDDPYPLPQQVTIELGTDRPGLGPIHPQHTLDLKRGPLSLDAIAPVFEQLAVAPDVAVRFGGLGDGLLHEDWRSFVAAARDAGLWGVAIDTDLQVEPPAVDALLEAPLDAVIVHLNADSEAAYADLMGRASWTAACKNIERLLKGRGRTGARGLPWVVPVMTKTQRNAAEIEGFVDRWVYFAGCAVVDGFTTGCGLVDDQAVLDMSPPRRFACRQITGRMTIHSDGVVPRCDQDWQARAPLGHVSEIKINEMSQQLAKLHAQHREGDYPGPCADCRQWYRP